MPTGSATRACAPPSAPSRTASPTRGGWRRWIPLTGIANRQAILDLVDEELARAARYRHPLSVIMADLDHFKRLNDSHGHAAGDLVLRHVGALLAANVRGVDTAGRYGGEEFLIVLPETDADAAASVAEKLRRIVGGTPLRLPDGETVVVTLSAGVAGGLGGVLRPDVLVRDADAALYSAKALGRDQVYVFRETGDEGTIRRAPIAAEARNRALDVGREAMRAATDALMRTLVGPPLVGRQAVHAHRRGVRRARPRDRPAEGRAGADPDRQPAPRPRQARDPRRDPRQAGRPRRVRVAGRDRAPQDRPGRPGAGGRAARRGDDRPAPPRVVRRPRLPARPRRDRDPGRRPHRVHRGRLRGDDRRAPVPRPPSRTRRPSRSCAARAASSSTRSSWRSSPRSSRPAFPGSRTRTTTTTTTVPLPPTPTSSTCRGAGLPPTGSGAGRTRTLTTAELHDAVHDRRRRAG